MYLLNKRTVLFVVGLFVIYTLLCFLLPQSFISNKETGSSEGSLVRFRELKDYKNIDLLFLGSSHSYRSFDTRIFSTAGYATFNLGSALQTPFNSYYLLKEYFDQLKPKVVILEVYYLTLEKEGVESSLDIIVNHRLTKNTIAMGLATKNIGVMNTLYSEYLKRLVIPLEDKKQSKALEGNYVKGGYLETNLINKMERRNSYDSHVIKMNKQQIDYLKRLIHFIKNRGGQVVLVVQPLPKYVLNGLKNYDDVSKKLKKTADFYNIKYIDFNPLVVLNDYDDFKDSDHLNQNGVKKFNEKFIEVLKQEEILK